ncbi:uncharacterized protein EI90DRAFT_3032702 [Cantharellus anzutake]|uniref:uncharacterized protein n=1 Tax=Cantharellus anzutake TaxID=1750568 RepID=UPI001908B964|nr:uncharacterized protein EI90DRAFT_3032702 [Cantharellus anzutake]KAF8342274.1 hypothetical protein EI90DRAFT_3032702 [Cantharellus anzutake]
MMDAIGAEIEATRHLTRPDSTQPEDLTHPTRSLMYSVKSRDSRTATHTHTLNCFLRFSPSPFCSVLTQPKLVTILFLPLFHSLFTPMISHAYSTGPIRETLLTVICGRYLNTRLVEGQIIPYLEGSIFILAHRVQTLINSLRHQQCSTSAGRFVSL